MASQQPSKPGDAATHPTDTSMRDPASLSASSTAFRANRLKAWSVAALALVGAAAVIDGLRVANIAHSATPLLATGLALLVFVVMFIFNDAGNVELQFQDFKVSFVREVQNAVQDVAAAEGLAEMKRRLDELNQQLVVATFPDFTPHTAHDLARQRRLYRWRSAQSAAPYPSDQMPENLPLVATSSAIVDGNEVKLQLSLVGKTTRVIACVVSFPNGIEYSRTVADSDTKWRRSISLIFPGDFVDETKIDSGEYPVNWFEYAWRTRRLIASDTFVIEAH